MCEKCKLRKEIAAAEAVDIYALHFIPDGSDKPLPLTMEDDYTITPADVRRALRFWDRLMPEYAGLLEARRA